MFGESEACIVAFTSPVLDMYALIDDMGTRGWRLNPLQNPPGLVSQSNKPLYFLKDLVSRYQDHLALTYSKGLGFV